MSGISRGNCNRGLYGLPEEPYRSDITTNCVKNRVESIADNDDEVNNIKIQKSFERLNHRDVSNLIQYWSVSSNGKCNLLTTVDKPFRLGIHNQGLCSYRSESERSSFCVDGQCNNEDLVPIVRVFRRQLSEWTYDVKNYQSKKHHRLLDCAIRWNLHGYLVLPVFDSITTLCVGVIELITSSKYIDCAYEVQEIHQALKEANLTSPQAFECPASYVNYKNHELDEIFKLLKDVCDTHKLPLAQTWTVSSRRTFVATPRNLERTCNSFNTRCIGKVCMSTTGLPFYVNDLRFWNFREACRKHHLLKSKGVVGRVLSSHGSCFCNDVTKLQEDEYSLVHNARISGLSSCYAVYLHSNEHDEGYILDFFLPIDMKEDTELQNLVQMMNMDFKFSSFKFGDLMSMDVVGMTKEVSQVSLAVQLDQLGVGETYTQIDYIHSQDQCDFGQVSHMNCSTAMTNSVGMSLDDVTSKKIDVVTCTTQRRRRKMDSVTPKTSQRYIGKPIGEASRKLVVRGSTPKRVCHELSIASWPTPDHIMKYTRFGIFDVVLLLIRIKRWICLSNHQEFSARWWICGKHNAFVCKSNPSAIISPNFSEVTKKSDDFKETSSKPSQAHSGVYQSSPKKNNVGNVYDTMMVTIKATFNDDTVKFWFHLSSGVLELKNQVAQRFNLKGTRLCLKYLDEDNDPILISCDADFRNLMPFSASLVGKHTIKLIVELCG